MAAALVFGIGGCAVGEPSYKAVREEVIASLEDIVSVVPDPKEVVREPDDEPYSCSDPLLMSNREGAFFTGQWAVYIPEEFDVDSFVAALPGLLGDGWEKQESSIEVSFANVDLVRKEPRVTVSVQEAIIDGRKSLDLIAISRCGILSDEDRSPAASASPGFDPLG